MVIEVEKTPLFGLKLDLNLPNKVNTTMTSVLDAHLSYQNIFDPDNVIVSRHEFYSSLG